MALEDVDYLYKNSTKKSYMFYIDSKDRDRDLYPNPNHYAITFSAPFKNVYSLEVLDASIPRTQHAVDTHNNVLVYKYDDVITNLHIPVGDYDSKNLIIVLNNEFNKNGHDITIDNVSIPADERSVFVFKSSKELILDMYKSTINTLLGFDLLAVKNNIDELGNERYNLVSDINAEYDTVEILNKPTDENDTNYEKNLNAFYENRKYINNYKNKLFKSTRQGIQYYQQNNAFVGPLNLNTSLILNNTNDTLYNAIAQTFTIEENSIIENIELNFNDTKTVDFGVVFYKIENDTYTPENNLKINNNGTVSHTFTKESFEYVKNLSISDERSEKNTKYMIGIYTNNTDNVQIGINLMESNFSNENMYVFNFDLENAGTLTNADLYNVNIDENKNVSTNTLDSGNAHMCIKITTKIQLNKIEAPGMYSLIGDRYVILKCPEIEQHLYASHSFEKYTMGIAKFKLAVLGYDESRFDFASLPPREFHPIGKLTQMTFMFERPDKTLYNFRGINHTITLAIRYMVPAQNRSFNKYILNPEYNPNFLDYQNNQESESDNENSD
jgi:hypothetical protein